MPLIINTEKLKGELNEHFRTKKRALADVRLTRQVLSEACPIIERRLGDPNYLRQFTHMGKQAFYNDEPGGQKELIGLFSTGQRKGDHMVNQFKVIPHVAAGGYGSFEITNSKVVYSRRYGKINLFEWLWKGFGPWVAKTTTVHMRLSQSAIWQRSWAQRRSWRRGYTFYNENPMTFYYRYGGKWFYKLRSRRGMDEGLVDKFHNYVFGAIEYGIEKAIRNIVESGAGPATMKKILEELR
jgi:hypothetical protein